MPYEPITCQPHIIENPRGERADEARMFQGIPAIEAAPGRLWAAWYGGGLTEDRENYVMLATSDDDGRTWSKPILAVDPDGPGPVRAFDPCLWIDPQGRLWLFWAQCDTERRDAEGRGWGKAPGPGVRETWGMCAPDPTEARPQFSDPRPLFGGVTMNKPIVAADGRWLACASWWFHEDSPGVVQSIDQGENWKRIGAPHHPDAADRTFDEHMVVERRDGSLYMLVRTKYGIGESVSTDGGHTWSDVAPAPLAHTSSRFCLRRLRSGRLLLIKHGTLTECSGRSHLSAYLSDDDGTSWQGGLVLDARDGVSYPDVAQPPDDTQDDGALRAIWDYDRYGERSILMARLRESDILGGALHSPDSAAGIPVNRATGKRPD